MALEVFTRRNFVADFFRQKLCFTGNNSKIAFWRHPLGDLEVTYTVHGSLESVWLTSYYCLSLLNFFASSYGGYGTSGGRLPTTLDVRKQSP